MEKEFESLNFFRQEIRYWAVQKHEAKRHIKYFTNSAAQHSQYSLSILMLDMYREDYKEICEAIHQTLPYR